MKKVISLLLMILTIFTFAACSNDQNTTDPNPDTSKPTTPPVIKVYPETMEAYVEEKYGAGWVRGEAIDEDLVQFTKDGISINVCKKDTLINKYQLPAEWFEGYFGDNGYATMKAQEINDYFNALMPQDFELKTLVLAGLTDAAGHYGLNIEKSWEENWATYSKQAVPTVLVFVEGEVTEEHLEAIEIAMAAPGYALHLSVIKIDNASLDNVQRIEELMTDPGDNLLLDIQMYVKD